MRAHSKRAGAAQPSFLASWLSEGVFPTGLLANQSHEHAHTWSTEELKKTLEVSLLPSSTYRMGWKRIPSEDESDAMCGA